MNRRFAADSLYWVGAVAVVLDVGVDCAESIWGFPTGSFMDNKEGIFTIANVMAFFFFQAAYSIDGKSGFFLNCSCLLAAVLPANDIIAGNALDYINPYLSPNLPSPLYDRTEWLLGLVGLGFMCLNVYLWRRKT
jgi:hypothetical protein